MRTGKKPQERRYAVGENVLLRDGDAWTPGVVYSVKRSKIGIRYRVEYAKGMASNLPGSYLKPAPPTPKPRLVLVKRAAEIVEPEAVEPVLAEQACGNEYRHDFFVSDEAKARVEDLRIATKKLTEWQVLKKLPHRKPSLVDAQSFLIAWDNGLRDTAQIASLTAILRGLESEAREWDDKNKVDPPFLLSSWGKFDIENAKAGNQAAKAVGDAAEDAKQFAKDFAKEANNVVKELPAAVPGWVWVAGGVVVGLFGLAQVATISRAASAAESARV